MKAFKQINLSFENRLVFSYAAILCFLCSFIVLNPLFGQVQEKADSNRPEVKIDVQKEFDEQGNVIGYDSTYSWYFSGKKLTNFDFDSIFEGSQDYFNDWNKYFDRKYFKQYSQLLYQDWQWQNLDSSMFSDLGNLFDEEFLDQLNFRNEYFPFYDSSISFNFEEFSHQFKEDHNDYFERLKNYQEEHQQLIEKYFGEPFKEDETDVKYDQQKYSPQKNNSKIEIRI